MNIQERNNLIGLHNQLADLNKNSVENTNPVFVNANRYWQQLTRPPIEYYIPQNILSELYAIMMDRKLYNKPLKRFKLVNDLLAKIGLRPLASGTNRRTFYCEYDPGTVFKIGSDSTGMSDNLNEYTMQNLLRPFFAKMCHVTPDGFISISERVETMTEKDYKIIWSKEIFAIIVDLLSRGYIMEDIGSNYFKNWGIRIGYGPVLLDCPYIYKVDRRKLKCLHKDPITKEVCNGPIDYDYDKGMSQIICTKCGIRYYASELAQAFPSESVTKIVKGRFYKMGYLDNNIKMQIVDDNGRVLRRYFNETDVQLDSQNKGARRVAVEDSVPYQGGVVQPSQVINTNNVYPNGAQGQQGSTQYAGQPPIQNQINNNIQQPPPVQNNINIIPQPSNVITLPQQQYKHVVDFINRQDSKIIQIHGVDIEEGLVHAIKQVTDVDIRTLDESSLYQYLTGTNADKYWGSKLNANDFAYFATFAEKFIQNYKQKQKQNENIEFTDLGGILIPKFLVAKINTITKNKLESMSIPQLYQFFENPNTMALLGANLELNNFEVYQQFRSIFLSKHKVSQHINTVHEQQTAKMKNAVYQNIPTSQQPNNTNTSYFDIPISDKLLQHLLKTFQTYHVSENSMDDVYEFLNTDTIRTLFQSTIDPILFDEFTKFIYSLHIKYGESLTKQPTTEPVTNIQNQVVSNVNQQNQTPVIQTANINQPVQQQKTSQNQTVIDKVEVKTSTDRIVIKKASDNIDERGNTIGKIDEWSEYYREGEKFILYPKDVKNELIFTLRKLEQKFDYKTAEFIARTLKLKYIQSDEFNKDRTKASLKTTSQQQQTPSSQPPVITQRYHPYQSQSKSNYIAASQYPQYQTQNVNPDADWKSRPINQETQQPVQQGYQLDPNQQYFVERPKTREELEAERTQTLDNPNAFYGIPGESKVDTMKFERAAAQIKEKVTLKFDKCPAEVDIDKQVVQLETDIQNYVIANLRAMTNNDGKGIQVLVKHDRDSKNQLGFKVLVENYHALFFETFLLIVDKEETTEPTPVEPKEEKVSAPSPSNKMTYEEYKRQQQQQYNSQMSGIGQETRDVPNFDVTAFLRNETALNKFFNRAVQEYSKNLATIKDIEEAKKLLIGYLYSSLIDYTKNTVNMVYAKKLATNYVQEQCKFSVEEPKAPPTEKETPKQATATLTAKYELKHAQPQTQNSNPQPVQQNTIASQI